ncbi:MAG: hypothetical protein K8R69_04115 [Deltaproteobacteria bacterium]|nr:hypothetical protein [Deltaproteobacteria bacterium]
MPDVAKGEFLLERLKYENPRYRTEQRGIAMTMAMDSRGWNLALKDDFDSVPTGEEGKSIVGGHLDLNFGFHLPWAELLRSVRGEAPTTETAPSLLAVFAGKPAGLDWKWLIDLGPNLFAVRLNLALDADAAKIAAKTPVVLNGDSPKAEGREYALALLKSFLSDGRMDFQIQIDRLSRMQAAMEKIKSGSSMGLALAGAYVEVDAKSDTLKANLKIEEGQVLLNGKKNETIQNLLHGNF